MILVVIFHWPFRTETKPWRMELLPFHSAGGLHSSEDQFWGASASTVHTVYNAANSFPWNLH